MGQKKIQKIQSRCCVSISPCKRRVRLWLAFLSVVNISGPHAPLQGHAPLTAPLVVCRGKVNVCLHPDGRAAVVFNGEKIRPHCITRRKFVFFFFFLRIGQRDFLEILVIRFERNATRRSMSSATKRAGWPRAHDLYPRRFFQVVERMGCAREFHNQKVT